MALLQIQKAIKYLFIKVYYLVDLKIIEVCRNSFKNLVV